MPTGPRGLMQPAARTHRTSATTLRENVRTAFGVIIIRKVLASCPARLALRNIVQSFSAPQSTAGGAYRKPRIHLPEKSSPRQPEATSQAFLVVYSAAGARSRCALSDCVSRIQSLQKRLDSLRVQASQVASSEAAMRRPQALSAELRTGLVVKGYVAGETADVPRNMRNLRRPPTTKRY